MSKKEIIFECETCGYKSLKWIGKCPSCGEWNSFVEIKKELLKEESFSKSLKLSEVEEASLNRIPTGFVEFDRVLGGGIVSGSVILLGGDPGVGKSTLLIQALSSIGENENVLYSSGEESLSQIAERAKRVTAHSESLHLLSTTSLNNVLSEAENIKAKVIVIDSIQTITLSTIMASAGSLAQIRECAFKIINFAKEKNVSFFMVGHITKEGIIAGPKVLEHMVDVVLYLEGDNYKNLKVLRAQKNRFGTINEIALFEMMSEGLKEVLNPSEILLKDRLKGESGSSIGVAIEGTRAILFEIQSLLSPSVFGLAKRMSVGFDRNRMQLLTAVIERTTKSPLGDKDIFINVVGGVTVSDPALDLPLCLSIYSSMKNKPIDEDISSFGEVGLLGEIRATSFPEKRIRECEKLGFKKILLPYSDFERLNEKPHKSNLIPVSNLKEAFAYLNH